MKVHPVSVAEPSEFAGPMTLPCRTVLEQPQIQFIWDEQTIGKGIEYNALQMCRKCYEAIAERYVYGLAEGRTYEAGIVNGEELKQK